MTFAPSTRLLSGRRYDTGWRYDDPNMRAPDRRMAFSTYARAFTPPGVPTRRPAKESAASVRRSAMARWPSTRAPRRAPASDGPVSVLAVESEGRVAHAAAVTQRASEGSARRASLVGIVVKIRVGNKWLGRNANSCGRTSRAGRPAAPIL